MDLDKERLSYYKYELDDVVGLDGTEDLVVFNACKGCDSYGLRMTRDDARRLAMALLRAVGERPGEVECVDCGKPEDVEAVYCRGCMHKNSEARGQNRRRDALKETIGILRDKVIEIESINLIEELLNKEFP